MTIKMKVLILTMLAAFMVFGCGRADKGIDQYGSNDVLYGRTTASSRSMPMAAIKESADFSYNEAVVMHDSIRIEEGINESQAASLTNSERKLIKRAYIRIRVDNLAAADASITDLMNKYSAYSASTVVEENSRHYSLRVPALRYDEFLAETNGMGRLLHQSENTEDVTLRYYDLEGRLEMKRTLLRTFQSYLTRARTIEEILSVEARIAELQNDIEGTGVQLRYLANSVDYATIDLNLLGPVAGTQKQNETLGERIKQLFGSFGSFLSTVLVVIIGIVIFGIPIFILAALLFWLLFGRIGLLRKFWGVVKGKEE